MCSSRGAFAKWSSFNFRAKDTRKVSLKDWQGIYWVSHFIYLLYRWREWWTWKHVSDIDDHEGGDQKDDHDDDDISLTLLMITTMMLWVSPYWWWSWLWSWWWWWSWWWSWWWRKSHPIDGDRMEWVRLRRVGRHVAALSYQESHLKKLIWIQLRFDFFLNFNEMATTHLHYKLVPLGRAS